MTVIIADGGNGEEGGEPETHPVPEHTHPVTEHTHGPTEDDVSRAERLALVETQSNEHSESPHVTHDDARAIARSVMWEEAAELQRMADEAAAAAVAQQQADEEAAAAAAAEAGSGEEQTIVTPDVKDTPKESFFRRVL